MQRIRKAFNGGSESAKEKVHKEPKHKEQEAQKKASKVDKPETTNKSDKKPATQSRATTKNSALKPGNNSGLKNKNGSTTLVQFGPVIQEFLSSKALVNKSLVVKYRQENDKTEVDFTFSEVMPNGVTVSQPKTLDLGNYMAQKNIILKKKDDAALLVDFSKTLLNRLGLDVTSMKPSVDPTSVKSFIMKHLSPVEREIVRLSQDEYDVVDTTKVPEILKPTLSVIDNVYGGFEERSEYLVTQINSTTPVVDIEPPNWVLNGVSGISKAVLLETLKLKKKTEFSDDQKAAFAMLAKQLHMEDDNLGTEKAEESKTTDI